MTLNKDNKKTEYNNINKLSTNIFDFIKDNLISDGNFIYFYDKVFDDDYTLKDKSLSKREEIITHIFKEDESRKSLLLVLVYTYLSKKSFSINKSKIDTMLIEEKIPLIYEINTIIDDNSSTYEILKHYSYLGITTKQIIDKHKAVEVINENAKKHLSKISYEDILLLTKEQLRNIKLSLLYDWCKITNNIDKQEHINKLYNKL